MNDFKKCELQIIHLDMTTYINRTPMLNESPCHKELKDKVQRMIENYCEHKKDNSPLFTPTDDLPCAYMCYECNKVYCDDDKE